MRKSKHKKKNIIRNAWNFLWHDDSLLSWAVLMLLGMAFIWFLFFPLSGMIFSSELPFVVIESGSMVHKGNFDEWWNYSGMWYENVGIDKEDFEKFPFKNGMNVGDIIIVKGCDDYEVGDVIVFDIPDSKPIIHRIVEEIKSNVTSTKGDDNPDKLMIERRIEKRQIIGRAVFIIPKLGYIKLAPCMLVPDFCAAIDRMRR